MRFKNKHLNSGSANVNTINIWRVKRSLSNYT